MPKISQFPSGGVAQNTDLIPVVRNGGDYTITGYNLASLASYGQAYVGTFTATAGQTVFTLPASPGSLANLYISVDGAVMVPSSDYTWTSPTTLTFTTGLSNGQTVLYRYTTSVPVGTAIAGGVNGQLLYNNSGIVNGTTIGGDATLVATTGALTVTKTNGVAFAASATTNTTVTGNITYTQGGTGATSRTVTSKLQESVSVLDFGADPTGATDSTAAILAAITASPTGVVFPAGGTYKVASTITLPASNVNLIGNGATITSTTAGYIFKQSNRGYLFSMSGLNFTGTSAAFYYNGPSSKYATEYYECYITNCNFRQTSGNALYFVGIRETEITDCYFEANAGIYFNYSVNAEINNCVWKNCSTCVQADNSEGVRLNGGSALGGTNGLVSNYGTWISINGTCLDYIPAPVYFNGCIFCSVNNAYISTPTSTAAAINIQGGARHVINGCPNILANNVAASFTGSTSGSTLTLTSTPTTVLNGAFAIGQYLQGAGIPAGTTITALLTGSLGVNGSTYSLSTTPGTIGSESMTTGVPAITVASVVELTMTGNQMSGSQSVHLYGTSMTYLTAVGNMFGYDANNVQSVVLDAASSDAVVYGNQVFSQIAIASTTRTKIWGNNGWVSENSGSQASGTGVTSFTINHGLAATPSINNIVLTLQSTTQAGLIIWVSAVTSSNFTVSASASITPSFTVGWRASLKA